ncbi:EscU/YscU/HrcU family type III secretion system export apparatus switch protein [Litorivicinus sp.]|nr:EscU/YscU/HrcU family type III secretion system export apparatus switch protein [Litorivicinus sp.]MDB9862113.1 EscU/YscU/HrcU family type III secretion system export apparatus switch protein [Litorivicinus sp.]
MKRPIKEAIALEYGQQTAPTILAKGSEELALEIIAEAKKQGIFVAEDAQLVAALSQIGLSEEIPEELYHAVAVMLSWAYWMKGLSPRDQ